MGGNDRGMWKRLVGPLEPASVGPTTGMTCGCMLWCWSAGSTDQAGVDGRLAPGRLARHRPVAVANNEAGAPDTHDGVSWQDATTQRGQRHALHRPAMRPLANLVSRSQAGDVAPTDVATSWAMARFWPDRAPPSNPPYRLAIHRRVRSASA